MMENSIYQHDTFKKYNFGTHAVWTSVNTLHTKKTCFWTACVCETKNKANLHINSEEIDAADEAVWAVSMVFLLWLWVAIGNNSNSCNVNQLLMYLQHQQNCSYGCYVQHWFRPSSVLCVTFSVFLIQNGTFSSVKVSFTRYLISTVITIVIADNIR